MFASINDSLLLIALAMGYIVVSFAHKEEEKGVQLAGYIIGFTVIILAAAYIVLNSWLYSWSGCPLAKKRPCMRPGAKMMQMQPMLPKELPKAP